MTSPIPRFNHSKFEEKSHIRGITKFWIFDFLIRSFFFSLLSYTENFEFSWFCYHLFVLIKLLVNSIQNFMFSQLTVSSCQKIAKHTKSCCLFGNFSISCKILIKWVKKYTVCKVSISGVILARIFPHLDRILRDTP